MSDRYHPLPAEDSVAGQAVAAAGPSPSPQPPASGSAAATGGDARPAQSWGRAASVFSQSQAARGQGQGHARTNTVGSMASSPAAGAHGSLPASGSYSRATLTPSGRAVPAARSVARTPVYAASPRQASIRALRLLAKPSGGIKRPDSSSSSSSESSEDEVESHAAAAARVRRMESTNGDNSAGASGNNSRRDSSTAVDIADSAAAASAAAAAAVSSPRNSDSSSDEEETIINRWSSLVNRDRDVAERNFTRAREGLPPLSSSVVDHAAAGALAESSPMNIASNGRPPAHPISSVASSQRTVVHSFDVGASSAIQSSAEDGPRHVPVPLDIPSTPAAHGDDAGNIASGSFTGSLMGSPYAPSASARAAAGAHAHPFSEHRRNKSRARSKTTSRRESMGNGEDSSSVPLQSPRKHRSSHPSSLLSSFQSIKWGVLLRRIPYYVPCLSWMPKYPVWENLPHDIFAGVTVGIMLVPQGLTYAALANLPPVYGLYTAFFPLLIYVLLGSSRHLSVGPEITSSILIGKAITDFPMIPAGDISDPIVAEALISAALALTFAIGLVALLLGLTRLGFLDSILSKPMLSGFVLAVACTLICEQLPVLTGLSTECGEVCRPGKMPIGILIHVLSHLHQSQWHTVLISIICCSFMFLFTFLKSRFPHNRVLSCVPDVLIVVVGATLISYLCDLQQYGVVLYGKMVYGFRAPALPDLAVGSPSSLISSAFTIAILGFVETQLINKKYASKHQYIISANRELVAIGVAQIVGAICGAYAGFGSIPRTKVSESAGVRSQLGNLVAAIVVMFVIVFFLPHFSHMPRCVSASIILVVAVSLLDLHELLFVVRVRQWVDLLLLVAMFLVSFTLGLDVGIAFAFAACLLLAVKQTTLPGVTMLGRGFANDDFHDLGDVDEEATNVEGILIYRIEGPLYFANAEKLKDSTKRAETQGGFHIHPSEEPHPLAITAVVLDLSALTTVDASALMILLEIVESYRARNARVCFVKLRKALRPAFESAGILALVGKENCFRKLEKAVAEVQAQNLQNLATISDALEEGAILDPGLVEPEEGKGDVTGMPVAPGAGVFGAGGVQTPTAVGTPRTSALIMTGSLRRKKSSFFAPPLVGSPLLRGMTKMRM